MRSYGASAKKSLKILQWVHFVPAFDKWFNEKYVKEWGDKNNTEVTVDNIGIAGISARAAAEVSAQKGHDIFLFNWPPPFYEEQVVDMKDVYAECEKSTANPSISPSRARTILKPEILRLLSFLYAGSHQLAQGPLGRRRSRA